MSVVMRFGKKPKLGSIPASIKSQTLALETRVRAAVRRCIAEEVERLVDMLDALDGDADMEEEPDREDGGDAEPSLGWLNPMGEQLDALRNAALLPPWAPPLRRPRAGRGGRAARGRGRRT